MRQRKIFLFSLLLCNKKVDFYFLFFEISHAGNITILKEKWKKGVLIIIAKVCGTQHPFGNRFVRPCVGREIAVPSV